MDWIVSNWELIGGTLLAALALAAAIAKITKTPKDDSIIARITAVVAKLFSTKTNVERKP